MEGVAIAIGEALDTSVSSMMKSISRALSGLTEWIGKNKEIVKKVALIVAGVVGVTEYKRIWQHKYFGKHLRK